MNTKGYLDLSTGQLTSTLGGSDIQFPNLPFGTELTLGLRLAEQLEGRSVETERTIDSFRASVGRLDTRPESGSFNLEIGNEGTPDTTADLPYNATAQEVQDAINAISSSQMTALGAATVELLDESYIVTFDNETTASYAQPTEITIYDENSLFPVSFLRSRASRFNNKWRHDLRLVQAPVASTSTLTTKLPDAPYITEEIAGAEAGVGGTVIPEVQILHVPRDFRAGYQLKRNNIHTTTLTRADGTSQIEEALAPLADEGGTFKVEQGLDGQALISFEGEMAGIDQDMIEVVVVGDDPGYLTFTLDFNTAELAALMRDAEDGEIELPFEIEMEIEDPDNSAIKYSRKVYSSTLTLIRTLNWDGLAAAANIDWLRPPIDEVYGGFDYSQVSNGQLHYSDTVGNGSATSFVVDHNLNVNAHNVIVKQVSTGNLLVLGTDFSVTETNSNSLTVTALSGAPASNDWRVTVLGLELTSFFDPHTHSISDITGLQAILDDYGLRITALEGQAGGNPLRLNDTEDKSVVAEWTLPQLFEVYPSRTAVENVETINAIDTTELPRARGLLPAIHDATVLNLSTVLVGGKLPDAANYAQQVYVNNTGLDFRVSGGLGHRSTILEPGDYVGSDGRLWYAVEQYGATSETSFYPRAFERELFTIHINESQLRLRKTFELSFAFEAAILNSNADAQWVLVLEKGEYEQEENPATTGLNLKQITWDTTPWIEQRIILTPTSTVHRFGARVARSLVDSVDTITPQSRVYGALQSGLTAPSTPNFAVRARLTRFDSDDNEADPKGFVALKGLNLQGAEDSTIDSDATALKAEGTAIIQ